MNRTVGFGYTEPLWATLRMRRKGDARFTKVSLYLESNSHWTYATGLGLRLNEILENDYFFPTLLPALEAVLCDNL